MLYPQQNDLRNLLDLSGFWNFQLDPEETGEAQGWYHGVRTPRTIAVPASWNEQFQDTRDYLGVAWYERQIYVPQSWQGQRIFIRVGSANYAAKVWINGEMVGTHEGAHLPFACEISDQVAWGEPNVVIIMVDSKLTPTRVPPGNVKGGIMAGFGQGYPKTNFDFFPYAGLNRPVVLFTVPPQHIEDITVVTGIEQGDDTSHGLITVDVKAKGTHTGKLALTDAESHIACELTIENGTAVASFSVPNARLWSPDDPHLYQLTVTLYEESDGTKVIYRYTLDVGIRTVEVKGHQILLNGQPIFLKGFGRHEDFAITGRGLLPPLIVKDYSLLKWIGANSYRTAHYPYSEEEMMMADRHGVLIIDEIPAVGLSFEDGDEAIAERLRMCKQQLDELIARDKNHPSVIMWSVANEPFPPNMMQRFLGDEVPPVPATTTEFFRDLFDLARDLDPTRLVTVVGVMGGPVEWLALADVVLINRYFGWYMQGGQLAEGAVMLANELDMLYAQLQKPIVVSEFGADTVTGHHSDPPEMFSEEYQVEFIRRYLDVAAERPFMAGMHVWNFADFKTGQGTFRVQAMNLKGVFTRDRRPKMAAHFLRERWHEGNQR